MWKIWANKLFPNALKSCPKSNKSPNLVTLFVGRLRYWKGKILEMSKLNYDNAFRSNDRGGVEEEEK